MSAQDSRKILEDINFKKQQLAKGLAPTIVRIQFRLFWNFTNEKYYFR